MLRLLLLLGLLLRNPEAPVGLLGAQVAKLLALLGDEFAPLRRRQVRVAQVLPLLGEQIAQLLPVLQPRLRVALQLARLLRVGRNAALFALLGDEVADFVTLLGDELAPFGRLEVLVAQFVLCFACKSRSC